MTNVVVGVDRVVGAAMYGAIGWRGLGPYTVLTHSQFQLAISIEALSWASR